MPTAERPKFCTTAQCPNTISNTCRMIEWMRYGFISKASRTKEFERLLKKAEENPAELIQECQQKIW